MATFYGKGGTKMENEMKTGMTNIRPAEIHAVKNTGKTTIKSNTCRSESSGSGHCQDAATDCNKSSSGFYIN
jgi:hypothetical protein